MIKQNLKDAQLLPQTKKLIKRKKNYILFKILVLHLMLILYIFSIAKNGYFFSVIVHTLRKKYKYSLSSVLFELDKISTDIFYVPQLLISYFNFQIPDKDPVSYSSLSAI